MRIALWIWWLALAGAAVLLGPAPTGETITLFGNLMLGRYGHYNPVLVAEWNLVGVVWLGFAALMWNERGSGTPHPGWFLLGAFFIGALALIPYYALRSEHYTLAAPRSGVGRFLDAPMLGWFLAAAAVGLAAMALLRGDGPDFVALARREWFVFVMSCDFVSLTLLLSLVALPADMKRRDCYSPARWAAYAAPIVGPMLYLARRQRVAPPTA